jgi:hypothetical protein
VVAARLPQPSVKDATPNFGVGMGRSMRALGVFNEVKADYERSIANVTDPEQRAEILEQVHARSAPKVFAARARGQPALAPGARAPAALMPARRRHSRSRGSWAGSTTRRHSLWRRCRGARGTVGCRAHTSTRWLCSPTRRRVGAAPPLPAPGVAWRRGARG